MKGLVTVFGGSGFVGAQIVRALAREAWRIRVAVRRPGRAYRLPMLGDVGQIEIVQANILDAPSVERALDGAEAVVNAVAVLYEAGRQRFADLHVGAAGNWRATPGPAGLGGSCRSRPWGPAKPRPRATLAPRRKGRLRFGSTLARRW